MSNGTIHCYGSPIFLKKSFGTGYQLRLAKSVDFTIQNKEELDEFIKEHFNDSKKHSESQGEIIYLLNANTESKCTEMVKDGQFANFFSEFDDRKESLRITSCGMSITTLEDVFLRVTASNEFIFDVQYNDNIVKKAPLPSIDFGRKASTFQFENALNEDVTLTSYKEINGLDFSSLLDVDLNSYDESTMDINSNFDEIENCFLLGLQRLKGLIIKRLHYLRQTYIMFLIQLFIPLLVFSIILYVDKFLRSRLHFDRPFDLDYNLMYENDKATAYFQYNKNEPEFLSSYIDAAKEDRIQVENVSSELNLNRVILNKVDEIGISSYVQRIIIGSSEESNAIEPRNHTQKSFDVWFNNEVLHGLPMSVNILYESILRHLNLYSTYSKTEKIPLKIHTTNHPFPNQLHYMYHFTAIQQFKIMWSLLVSLSLPFLGAYYSVFCIQEQLTRSKLLQIMAGVSHRLYWYVRCICF